MYNFFPYFYNNNFLQKLVYTEIIETKQVTIIYHFIFLYIPHKNQSKTLAILLGKFLFRISQMCSTRMESLHKIKLYR